MPCPNPKVPPDNPKPCVRKHRVCPKNGAPPPGSKEDSSSAFPKAEAPPLTPENGSSPKYPQTDPPLNCPKIDCSPNYLKIDSPPNCPNIDSPPNYSKIDSPPNCANIDSSPPPPIKECPICSKKESPPSLPPSPPPSAPPKKKTEPCNCRRIVEVQEPQPKIQTDLRPHVNKECLFCIREKLRIGREGEPPIPTCKKKSDDLVSAKKTGPAVVDESIVNDKKPGPDVVDECKKPGPAVVDESKKQGTALVDESKKQGTALVDESKKQGTALVDESKKSEPVVVDEFKKPGPAVVIPPPPPLPSSSSICSCAAAAVCPPCKFSDSTSDPPSKEARAGRPCKPCDCATRKKSEKKNNMSQSASYGSNTQVTHQVSSCTPF